jgi:hypothetical protein
MRREKLGASEVGSLLDPATGMIGNILCMTPTVTLFLGFGLMTVAGEIHSSLSGEAALPLSQKAGRIAIGALGLVLVAASLVFVFRYPTAIGNLYFRWLARRTISRRIAPLVDPRDSEAAFVEIVPRAHWSGAMRLDTANEVGFLFVDRENRELLFEGNAERWRMPAQAITSCDVEGTNGTLPGITHPHSYAVLRTRGGEWPFEIPMTPRGRWDGRFISTGRRREVAGQLCLRIQSLLMEQEPQVKSKGP